MSIPMKPAVTPAVPSSDAAIPASCSSIITPACVQALYGIPTTLATESSNQLGVSGFIEQFANQADLKVNRASLIFYTFSPLMLE